MTIVLEISRPFQSRPWRFKSRLMYRFGWGWVAVCALQGILRDGTGVGEMKIGDIRINISVAQEALREFNRSVDRAARSLSRLRYPPRGPAKGSVSRRREKLKKAGIR